MIEKGEKLYSVATQNPVRRKQLKKLIKIIKKQEGNKAVFPCDRGILWLFDTLNHAKIARNALRSEGYIVGDNIARFTYDGKGISFDGPGEE